MRPQGTADSNSSLSLLAVGGSSGPSSSSSRAVACRRVFGSVCVLCLIVPMYKRILPNKYYFVHKRAMEYKNVVPLDII